MSETKHTPGPWVVVEADEIIFIDSPSGDAISQLSLKPDSGALGICSQTRLKNHQYNRQLRINAQLISTAPELLEACQTLEQWLTGEDAGPVYPEGTNRDTDRNESIWREWWNNQLRLCDLAQTQSRAAIAKATGRKA